MVWLCRSMKDCGDPETWTCVYEPAGIGDDGIFYGGHVLAEAKKLGLPEIPHGTKQEFTLTATPVPQPTRAAELWRPWNAVGRRWVTGIIILFVSQRECERYIISNLSNSSDWEAVRYDTCPIDSQIVPDGCDRGTLL